MLGVLFLLFSQPVWADSFTIQSAVQAALGKNPTVLAAQEKVNEMDQSITLAYSTLFPTITFNLSNNYKKDSSLTQFSLFGGEPYNTYSGGFQLSQPIFPGTLPWNGIKAPKASKQIAAIDHEVSKRDLILNIIQAFYSILLNQRKLNSLEQIQKVDQELLKVAQKRLQIGRSQRLDVLQFKTQLALLIPKVSQAKNAITISANQLAELLHESDAKKIEITGHLEHLSLEEIQSLLKTKTTRILEIEKADEQIILVEAQETIALAPHWPQLSATGSIGRTGYSKNDLLNDYATAWAVGLQLSIPLFSGLSSFYTRNAYASQKIQLEMNRTKITDQLSLSQVQTLKDLELAHDTLNTSTQAYQLAKEALNEAQKDYKLSTIDFQRYFGSQENFLDAEISHNQAKYDYIISLGKYFIAWGYPIEDLVQTLEKQP